ncbi:hypothetical protein vBKpMFBKp34_009 [Klebsiella phage vB_KpM_FBKp34]|nr:hypothetical protein vBKpMFBKp34_009 [Klebsiella phage vB_KpM_FBKp34]
MSYGLLTEEQARILRERMQKQKEEKDKEKG